MNSIHSLIEENRLTQTDNTAYHNGGTGFAFLYSSSRLRRNLTLAKTMGAFMTASG